MDVLFSTSWPRTMVNSCMLSVPGHGVALSVTFFDPDACTPSASARSAKQALIFHALTEKR